MNHFDPVLFCRVSEMESIYGKLSGAVMVQSRSQLKELNLLVGV
jgi:hypothetical protein